MKWKTLHKDISIHCLSSWREVWGSLRLFLLEEDIDVTLPTKMCTDLFSSDTHFKQLEAISLPKVSNLFSATNLQRLFQGPSWRQCYCGFSGYLGDSSSGYFWAEIFSLTLLSCMHIFAPTHPFTQPESLKSQGSTGLFSAWGKDLSQYFRFRKYWYFSHLHPQNNLVEPKWKVVKTLSIRFKLFYSVIKCIFCSSLQRPF